VSAQPGPPVLAPSLATGAATRFVVDGVALEGGADVDLAAALQESIARICGVPPEAVGPEVTLEELGIDSLVAAEVITDLEIHTGAELPMDVLRGLGDLRTVGQVADHISADPA
jgi:acyl carrier protein